jgi:hypothetical protein
MPSAEHESPIALAKLDPDLVAWLLANVFDDVRVARWYHRLFASDGLSLLLRPLIFTPRDVPVVVNMDMARVNPALAVLSAICHGGHAGVDDMFPALLEAMRSLGPGKAILYYDVVLAGLPASARTRWEAFMTTAVGRTYHSELFRELAARHEELGEARGEARGEGQAVLTVLDARGVPVPPAVREQVLACTDVAQLESWLRRAVTASTAEDVVHR